MVVQGTSPLSLSLHLIGHSNNFIKFVSTPRPTNANHRNPGNVIFICFQGWGYSFEHPRPFWIDFWPKAKQPRNNINETEKTCELCSTWCLLISGPRTIHFLQCPITEFLLIIWLGNLKVYLIVDVVIHISYGRISFNMFKEILASRNGGTREYVHFQVHPTHLPHHPIPSRAMGKWAETKPGPPGQCPLHSPREEFKLTLQIIFPTNRNVMVFAFCGSPHGANVNLDGCMHVPPKQKSQNARQKCWFPCQWTPSIPNILQIRSFLFKLGNKSLVWQLCWNVWIQCRGSCQFLCVFGLCHWGGKYKFTCMTPGHHDMKLVNCPMSQIV